MIRHSVIFKFKTGIGEIEKQRFFDAADTLSKIGGVQHLEVLKQTSPKNEFEFGILMRFDNTEAYQKYNTHPDHNLFIQNYWLKMVDKFLEIDYEPIIKNPVFNSDD